MMIQGGISPTWVPPHVGGSIEIRIPRPLPTEQKVPPHVGGSIEIDKRREPHSEDRVPPHVGGRIEIPNVIIYQALPCPSSCRREYRNQALAYKGKSALVPPLIGGSIEITLFHAF